MARFLFRLGRASARHRIVVLVLWIAIAVALGVGASHTKFSADAFSLPGSESSRALDRMHADFPATASSDDDGTGTLELVLTVPDGQQITSAENMTLVREVLTEAGKVPHVSAASNPFDAQRPYVSKDGATAVSTLSLTGLTGENREGVYDDVRTVAANARADGLDTQVGGSIGDFGAEGGQLTEGLGVLLAFVVLMFTFGSLVAAGANLLGALVGVAVGLLGVLTFSAIHPLTDTTPTLALMLGLAVGIDYCLFILARFRSELRDGRPVEEAIGRAVATAGSAVLFAAATVVIALAGLSVVRIGFLTEMGLAAAFTVAVAAAMAVTLLPVLMRTMGRRALPRRERRGAAPRASHSTRTTFLERWVRTVVRRPVLVGVLAIAGLLALAAPTLSMTTALSTPGGDDPNSTQRAAYNQIAAEFGPGAQNPLIVLVEGTAVNDQLPAVTHLLSGLDHVIAATPAGVAESGGAALVQVIPDGGPIEASTQDLVHRIRDASGDVAGVRLSVTGRTAVNIDTNSALQDALTTYLIVVVGLSLLLLIVLFRSLLVPLLATLGFLLSLGAAVGVTVAVFQWGWLDQLFAAPSGNPILSLLPILIVGILFGLAMDYQVFLVSRMHEAHRHGLSPVEAILDGFGRTAAVVAAAALIMGGVFAGFSLTPGSVIASLGLALAVGVLADAFVVRMIITPALLTLLGEKAWWMPRWLDRILPHLDAEGSALEETAAEPSAPVLAARR
ncbi:MMPL family transporter [Dactylosporangium sp. CA-092794]|uniref:MMPL family transporter n=1 Tax=Dactylosporangium sp. CA-092794 TaxID=3239929 RepID=UPI003D93A532